jgi:hypothetical protein
LTLSLKRLPRAVAATLALAGLGLDLGFAGVASAQTTTAQPTAPATTQDSTPSEQPPPPKGQVLFQSHGAPPTATPESEAQGRTVLAKPVEKPSGPELTDLERSAVTFVVYDLDARLVPATSRLAMRARLTLRNDGTEPLTRVALQISSTLNWETATLVSNTGSKPLDLTQHMLDTDADHSGQANEAIITLPTPLASGRSLTLNLLYSGTIAANGGRLERIGATHDQAIASDWDAISSDGTALRGFGDVLWYPVASPQLFLGDGNQLFNAVGRMKLRESSATIHLRLAVEYTGEPPVAVYFCGRRQPLVAISDSANAPTAAGSGVATAEFSAEPLGFRMPSLFQVERPETMLAPLAPPSVVPAAPAAASSEASSTSSSSNPAPVSPSTDAANGDPLLAVESTDDGSLPPLTTSAERAAPLLEEWLGPKPLSTLTILDHPGQPFEDGPLLVAPIADLATSNLSPALVHSLTHAWVQTGQPWMDEGLAQFFSLLWIEREQGRDAAVAQLTALMQPLGIAEPAIEDPDSQKNGQAKPEPVGEPLITATSELYFRRKAAAVWWMLRGIVGDKPLQLALRAWLTRTPGTTTPEQDALAFEALLEKTGKDPINLHWFFDDWVLHDRGLPDLSIIDVTPRLLPAGQGHSASWLVAVTAHNDGAAAVEVPLTIRSGTFSTTSRMRIAGFANATARVLVEAPPTEVVLNDGSAPEVRTSMHTREVVTRAQ